MQTAEHPENVAALDNQFAASPSKVKHEDIWPIKMTGAAKVRGDTEKGSQAKSSDDGHKVEPSKLLGGKDDSNPGKVLQ